METSSKTDTVTNRQVRVVHVYDGEYVETLDLYRAIQDLNRFHGNGESYWLRRLLTEGKAYTTSYEYQLLP